MRLKHIKPGKLYWQGQVALEKTADGIQPLRLPLEKLRLFDDFLVRVARRPAGVRLRFITDSSAIGLEYTPSKTKNKHGRIDSIIDITVDGKLWRTVALDPGKTTVAFDNLPSGDKVVEFWLDNSNPQLAVKGLLIAESASINPDHQLRPRWVTYGSSITQCAEAHSPARTWPALLARKFNLNLTCLGFGSNCLVEPMIGLVIRDLRTDFISLKLGANCMGSYTPRTFKANVIGLIEIIREKNPVAPIAVISPILCPALETCKNEKGLSFGLARELLCDAVERVQSCGVKNIHYISGLDLLNDEKLLRADKLHPTAEGYVHIADNLAPRLAAVFGLTR